MRILINLGYVLMLCAFITRDILWLRTLLVVSQTIVVIYTWLAGVPVVSIWNLAFASINAMMVVQILRDRRAVVLPPELRDLHARHFAALTPPEFLRWWRQGSRRTLRDERLAREGEQPAWLYFLLDGTVRVTHRNAAITELPAGYFVAEMSLLTGEPANADVDAVGAVEVMQWPTDQLHALRQRNPSFWSKIQSVIGHDLVEKIRRTP